MLCLVSGGADSTCLFHALRELGYRVSALHVDHGLRGDESDADAAWCAEHFDAEVVQGAARCATEAALRDVRYSFRANVLRATGHTLSDQVETIVYRLAARGTTNGIEVRRADGVVRPLLCVWREETEAFCRERGLEWRTDSSNPDTLRGVIRNEILPLLERIHPAARENVLRVLDERRTMPPALAELLGSPGRLEANRPRRGTAGRARIRPGLARVRARATSTAPSSGARGGSSLVCRDSRYEAGVRATGWSAGRRRSKMCSSMQRSRAPIEKGGRSSFAATRWSRSRGSSRPRG